MYRASAFGTAASLLASCTQERENPRSYSSSVARTRGPALSRLPNSQV
jgi:hypothetical protein